MEPQDRIDLGEVSDVAAIMNLFSLSGVRLLDVGCGAAANSRELVRSGATVIGIEPDPIQAEKNRSAEPIEGLELREGRAETLPFPSASIDGVVFFRSLHHVPIDAMDAALGEAARVLDGERSFLCLIEPGMDGSHFEVMRPFHDETVVRTAAQAAIARLAESGRFRRQVRYCFVQHPRHPSFEAMVTRMTGLTFNAITRDQVETDEVRALFERGRTEEGDYRFVQPMLMDVFEGPA